MIGARGARETFFAALGGADVRVGFAAAVELGPAGAPAPPLETAPCAARGSVRSARASATLVVIGLGKVIEAMSCCPPVNTLGTAMSRRAQKPRTFRAALCSQSACGPIT